MQERRIGVHRPHIAGADRHALGAQRGDEDLPRHAHVRRIVERHEQVRHVCGGRHCLTAATAARRKPGSSASSRRKTSALRVRHALTVSSLRNCARPTAAHNSGMRKLQPTILASSAGRMMFVEHHLAVIDDQPAAARDLRIVGDDHAALPGHDVLRLLKAEHASIAERAGLAAVPCRAGRLRGVLDDRQPVASGDRQQGIHVGDVAGQVHGHDRPGARPMAARTDSGSMQKVSGSTSTKTGIELNSRTALAVALKEIAGTMTSSPGPTPAAAKARR